MSVASVSLNDMSFLSLIYNADIVVKIAIFLLVLASIWSWSVIIEKFFIFKRLNVRSNNFEKIFWSGGDLDQLYDRLKNKTNHPMSAAFVAAMDELKRYDNTHLEQHYLTVSIKERVSQAMEIAKNKEMEQTEKNLALLGTIGSAAPFVGLFGTVWGIMISFQSIAAAKNVTLAVVAPGIAEALLATAIGLMAAIPAVIFYNIFANQLNSINAKIDDYLGELYNLISRKLDK
jgi:biopolymer transport protein TolQ